MILVLWVMNVLVTVVLNALSVLATSMCPLWVLTLLRRQGSPTTALLET